jgi:cytochrome c oxidase subunit 2
MIPQYHFILWAAVGAFAAICLVILGLLARVTLRRNARFFPAPREVLRQTSRDRLWTFAPMGVFALVAALLMRSVYLQNTTPASDLTITVTGHMWHWTYNYSNFGNFSFNAPMLVNSAGDKSATLRGYDHITVPVDKTVRIVAVATNVIYSWAVPDIGARIEALPGWTEKSSFKAAKEGRYYGQCLELCGLPHTFKPVEIEVVSQARFDKWVADARRKLVTAGVPRPHVAQAHS